MTVNPGPSHPAAISVAVSEHQWHPVDPGNPGGPTIAALWGDPMSGPYGALLRVPAGFESPLHRHSSDERVVVISGSSVHWTEGESRATATIVTAGDFMMMPAGLNHVSASAGEQDCLEFITMDGSSTSNWPKPGTAPGGAVPELRHLTARRRQATSRVPLHVTGARRRR